LTVTVKTFYIAKLNHCLKKEVCLIVIRTIEIKIFKGTNRFESCSLRVKNLEEIRKENRE